MMRNENYMLGMSQISFLEGRISGFSLNFSPLIAFSIFDSYAEYTYNVFKKTP